MGAEPPSLWHQGWYQHARALASPNFGARPAAASIDLVVIHSISLPPGEFGNGQVQRLFTNQLDWDAHPYFQSIRGLKVSSHFFITRSGQLWQFVSCDDRAWHAGESRYRGRDNCNDDSIGIELEGLEGGLFEATQYETLASICAALLRHYPVAHLAGHEHIASGRKQDPGVGFDWARLQRSLGLPAQCFPQNI
ncbi:1,6-anhydro-N-acetylmuramyl-L-alanine amidase AmpD [Polaromonas sp. SM01]|uniref:1,6-anhydro-N-acetylmuramyl-L-alanine amidase AmpD n=1 Tax=Polaromonas sp. SM01 TaxID=3085630 RepID=UPI002980D0D7|nr:1,6-anhydro-N-acetylmuramyl-L-alanine amidase AmpD [Polaromonas sp. SM01]MDW5445060.1 1,6-anhydro-N-acetylmuramyl-L-alanine amidase AmpD [Polaromonas sp. SM01]